MGQRRLGRLLPKYVHGYLDRHGKPRHYLRRRGRKDVPLPGLPWSDQFMSAYAAALNNSIPITIGIRRTKPGTVEEAVARYLGSAVFANWPQARRGCAAPFWNGFGLSTAKSAWACSTASTLRGSWGSFVPTLSAI